MVEVEKGVVGVEVVLIDGGASVNDWRGQGGGGVVLPDARGRVAVLQVEKGRLVRVWTPDRVITLEILLGWS